MLSESILYHFDKFCNSYDKIGAYALFFRSQTVKNCVNFTYFSAY